MATVNHTSQGSAQRDPRFAAPAAPAQVESAKAQRTAPIATAATSGEYPVILRLCDVSASTPAEALVHVTPLMVESALEIVGSGRAAGGTGPVDPNSAASSFATLLAASPSLQGSQAAGTSHQAVRTPTPAPPTRVRSAEAVIPETQATKVASVAEPVVESTPAQHRIDKPSIKPVRRAFRVSRPAWMPEIPPTLVLGLLICFSALLVGMLWRGNETDAPPNLAPAAHDQGEATQDQPARVATVPEIPKLQASTTSEQPATNSAETKPSAGKTATRPTPNKVSEAKAKPAAPKGEVAAKPKAADVNRAAESIPAPRITGIRALPHVEEYSAAAVYGQPQGGPPPHFVENPYANGQNPIYEARRPAAQFQGNIIPPNAAVPNERF